MNNKTILVGFAHVRALIRRNMRWQDVPEAQLWGAVLCQAVTDLELGRASVRADAERFFASEYFKKVCAVVGLEPAFVLDAVAMMGRSVSVGHAAGLAEAGE